MLTKSLHSEEKMTVSRKSGSVLKNRINLEYNAFYAWLYAFTHALGGFYFGYSMVIMNNLGKSIYIKSMDVDEEDYTKVLSLQNTVFGILKMAASLIAGLLANNPLAKRLLNKG